MPDKIDELAKRALIEGDSNAWPDLFEKVNPILVKYIGRLMASDSEIADVAQAAWVRILKGNYEFPRPFIAFAKWHAQCAWLDALRKRKRRGPRVALVVDPVSHAAQSIDLLAGQELEERIQGCLAQLNESERTIFNWKIEENLEYSEIAARLGQGVNALEGKFHRIRLKLRKCLGFPDLKKKQESRERKEEDDVLPHDDPDRVEDGKQ
jgi:RNA polymerase sigma factor (sigma-70 family)